MPAEKYIQKEQGFVIDFVSWVFSDVLEYILFTPFEFFKSATAISVLVKMGVFSGGLVTILTMIEGLKRTLSLKYTPMSQILYRYPIGLVISAIVPFLFYYAGMGTNELVKFMGLITHSSIEGVDHYTSMLQGVMEHVMEAVLMFFFLLVMVVYIFRILLYHANRWFGLLFNMVATPIAMTAYIFNPYQQVAKGWMADTIQKFLVTVFHSFFLGLIGVLLYAPTYQYVSGIVGISEYMIIKTLFAIGGLQMMLKPPAWIMAWFDKGDNFHSTTRAFSPIRKMLGKINFTFPKGGKTS
jgi:hypothetical protein